MTPAGAASLARECDVFVRYLVRVPPDAYIQKKYVQAHSVSPEYAAAGAFDRLLLALASSSPLVTSLADSYSGLFARSSALRKKLILLTAILESCAPARGFLDAPDHASLPGLYLRAALRGAFFALRCLGLAIVLLPLQLVLGGLGGQKK